MSTSYSAGAHEPDVLGTRDHDRDPALGVRTAKKSAVYLGGRPVPKGQVAAPDNIANAPTPPTNNPPNPASSPLAGTRA